MNILKRMMELLLSKANHTDDPAHARALRDVAEAIKQALEEAQQLYDTEYKGRKR